MKKHKDYTLLALAIPFFLAVLFNLPACYKSTTVTEKKPQKHYCKFVTCPYLGDDIYVHKHTGADEEKAADIGSDCDAIDKIHWQHPDWSYDECEEEMMRQ